jgi:hypothetical protein
MDRTDDEKMGAQGKMTNSKAFKQKLGDTQTDNSVIS